jgi:hypothetical protein
MRMKYGIIEPGLEAGIYVKRERLSSIKGQNEGIRLE